MRTLISICGVSWLVLLFTMQLLNVWFWIAAIVFVCTILPIGYKLDNINHQNNKRKCQQ